MARSASQQTSRMCVAFQGIDPTPPAEWKDIQSRLGSFWLQQVFGETADELWINFKMCLTNELVRYHECVVNYQEASTFSPNDTIAPN